MAAVVFDTHKFERKLKDQDEAISEAFQRT